MESLAVCRQGSAGFARSSSEPRVRDPIASGGLCGQRDVGTKKDQHNVNDDDKPVGHARRNLRTVCGPPRLKATGVNELFENVQESRQGKRPSKQ